MTVKEITGVRELTAQECVEINGGGIAKPLWKALRWIYKEFSEWCVVEYISSLFS